MANRPGNRGKIWTPAQVEQLRKLAKGNTPTRIIALELDRTQAAVQTKASAEGISLKPTNESPYNREPGA